MNDTAITIAPDGEPPGPLPAWITPTLLARTIEVWSKAYGRPISAREAVELLMNVKRLGEVLRVRPEAC